MKSYIHLYETNDEFTKAYNGPDYVEPWLSLTEENMTIGYNKPKLTAITFDSITWVTDVPATGGTATKDNCSFKVYAKYDNGASVDISSDATVTGELVVPSSTEGQRHEAGQLTLTASYSGFTATGSITAYQAAVDFSTKPLTFNILSAGTINWTVSDASIAKTIEYKVNDGEWTSITSNIGSSAPTITVNSGDKIQFRGNNTQYGIDSAYNSFGGSALFESEGNIMSLIYGDDFKNNLTISSTYAFKGLFSDCVNLVSAENLILPATTLADDCYDSMFYGCTSLTTAPELPATTLAAWCYYDMFDGCTSLTTVPSNLLLATTLADGCYSCMFWDCTSLTTAPELPATTLADSCYDSMFYGTNILPDCSNIDFTSSTVVASGGLKGLFSGTKVTDNDLERLLPKNDNGKYYLPATTLATSCYYQMFYNCTSLTTAPVLPATTLADYCYQFMFYNCTSLTTAPSVLPASTLASGCYDSMFYGCTSLTTAPSVLPASTLASGCYSNMFNNCTSLTIAPELPATSLADNCYEYMFANCTSLSTAPSVLPASTLASGCYSNMFNNCTSLTTAPELPATSLVRDCYQFMFYNCTSLTTAPELPADTLADSCYYYMFYGCTSLNYIKCLATDISASNCTKNWVYGVASTGTFVKAPSMTSWTTGINGIPANWTVEDNQEPLTFNILSAGTINWMASDSLASKTIEYKLNNGEWTSITSNIGSSAPTITVNSGDKLQFRGNNAQYATSAANYNSFSGSTALFEIEGSIMSLINSTRFVTATTLESDSTFSYLFNGCTGLTSAKNLILPATTLASECYSQMFNGCTSLTIAPELPATRLADYCYQFMFYNCTSLTTAPELPAATLVDGCYSGMFDNCTSLNYIKCLATDISATNCTLDWADGVASTGTFVKAPSMTSWTTGINGIPANWTVEDNQEPLTFNILSAGTINWMASDSLASKTIEYKLNNGEWTSITSNIGSSAPTINVVEGDKIQFKGSNTQYATSYSKYNSFDGSALFEAKGNIMSLIYGDNFKNKLTISSTYAFASLFRGCTKLVSAKNLVLPATSLADNCYYYMFEYCSSLTTVPELPATTLATQCYSYMFRGCTSLSTAPELPATTLADDCYQYMFYGCTSLTTAPKLPATTLATGCYSGMFSNCTSLTTAPALPATTLATWCYYNMFQNCTSLTTAPELPATDSVERCYSQMFQGCTSLATAPELPATTLAERCYENMFYGCTSLTTAPKELPATTLATQCYQYMFDGCTSLTTAPELPATTLATQCYYYMFNGCTSLTTAPKELPATTLTNWCYGYMFNGCTSLTTAPELPATELKISCYDTMFYGCTKLNYIKCMATDISASKCTNNWVSGVASTGTFVKASSMTSWTTGVNGIPTGWAVQDA